MAEMRSYELDRTVHEKYSEWIWPFTVFTAFTLLHTNYEPKISEWKQHLVCRTLFRNLAHY